MKKDEQQDEQQDDQQDALRERLRRAQAKYGDNHWWASGDPRTLAYYQINEEHLCVPFRQFHAAIEQLLGRPVQTFELGVNIEGLRTEAEAAYHGTPYSEEGKSANMQAALDSLIELKGAEKVLILRERSGDDDSDA